jgi:hypothetical protein
MGEKLFEVEYTPGEELVFRFRKPAFSLLPPEAREHLVGARIEALLALRALVDAAITRLEEEEPRRRRREIDIE